MGKRLNPYSVKSRHWLALTFAAALCMALLLFVPFIVFNNGIFFYFGDFNVQEIPFYQLIHGQVRDGTLGWNHLTDLGTDTLASYSFYLMGSPFFWLTIPFPNEFVPYLIGPILILKFACTASSAYLWLQRHVRFKGYAAVGGILYAFSGFSLYNVFFFHFHEPMMMFPLLLAALDCFLYDRRRGIFAVAVCAACVVNYYFFVGQALFVIMYFIVLACTKTWKFKITEFLLLALEVLIGFAGAMFMLLPSVLGLLGNPRLDSYPKGWNALVYDRPQRYWLMLLAFFFPADIPALPTFTQLAQEDDTAAHTLRGGSRAQQYVPAVKYLDFLHEMVLYARADDGARHHALRRGHARRLEPRLCLVGGNHGGLLAADRRYARFNGGEGQGDIQARRRG